MSRPARDMSHGLSPMSTITPIDLNAPTNGGSPVTTPQLPGLARANGHAYHGSSPAAGQHLTLQPPAHIETRSPSHSPRALHPRLSPEANLKPLSQLAPVNPNVHALGANPRQKPAQRGATIPPVQQRPTPSYYNLPDPGPSSASSGSSRTVRAGARRRAGSNPRPPLSTSSEDTETEVDSDSTFVPGRVRHQHSKSQPDLTALRSRLAESWANQQQEERRLREEAQANSLLSRRRSHGRKTPPIRPMSLSTGAHPHVHPLRQSSTGYASAQPQGALGLRHSPRTSTVALAHLTPITSSPRTESSAEDSPWSLRGVTLPHGGMTGSEDADDDLESNDSPSSGSLSFSPKLRRRQRQSEKRGGSGSGSGSGGAGPALGLLLEPNSADERGSQSLVDLRPESIEARLRRSSLLNFRLLAVVPALWGISVLTHALITGTLWHDVWPWGVDVSRESVERLMQGLHVYEGIERPVHRGDMTLAIAWVSPLSYFADPRPSSQPTSASASRRASPTAGVRTTPSHRPSPASSRSSASAGRQPTRRCGSSGLAGRFWHGSSSA